jgi:hypothetical protein
MSPEHVNTWISQFPSDVQLPMLQELDYVLKRTYISKEHMISWLEELITSDKLIDSNPCDFWKNAHFLDIQKNGHSQKELLTLFDDILKARCDLTTSECGAPGGDFVYLDDAIFSGKRMSNDLEDWIAVDAPEQAVIHIVVFVMHTLSRYQTCEKLKKLIEASGKDIEIKYHYDRLYENRYRDRKDSDVLWPATLPDNSDLKTYLESYHKFPFEARPEGGNLGPFSSELGRQLLERELLNAGIKIRVACNNPNDDLRPLGFSSFGLGFGSIVVTFRNCPNTCPLAFWWGDSTSFRESRQQTISKSRLLEQEEIDPADLLIHLMASSPLSKWYPLFPRKTYNEIRR